MTATALACDVWWAQPRHYHPALLESLDAAERTRHQAFVHEADQQRFVLGCAIARNVLGAHYRLAPERVSLDRTCGECGRPHGKVRDVTGDPPIDMSVSHSGDNVAVAFCHHGAVGVDVQRIDDSADPAAMSRHVLADIEATSIARLAPSARAAAFVTYWVRKEAVLKATAAGLRAPMTDVVVSAPDQPARLLNPYCDRPVQLHDLAPRPGYAAALAVIAPQRLHVRERDAQSLL